MENEFLEQDGCVCVPTIHGDESVSWHSSYLCPHHKHMWKMPTGVEELLVDIEKKASNVLSVYRLDSSPALTTEFITSQLTDAKMSIDFLFDLFRGKFDV